MHRKVGQFLLLLPWIAAVSGCALVTVTSDPPGAEIICSTTGAGPWEPWPPGTSKLRTTPTRKLTSSERYYFVRVRKEGYYPVRPELVDAGPLQRRRLHFKLDLTPQAKGLVLYEPEGRWVTPDEGERLEAESKRAQGLVQYQGEWMSPDEKFARQQHERGCVLFEGRWVKPDEEDLVRFKDQYMKREEAKRQREIDDEVQQIVASATTFPLRFEPISRPSDVAQLRVADHTKHPIEVLLSGPQSHRVVVTRSAPVTIQSLPGIYVLVIREIDRQTGRAGVAEVELVPRQSRLVIYRGEPADGEFSRSLPAERRAQARPDLSEQGRRRAGGRGALTVCCRTPRSETQSQ